jgi:dephospho-CoA kinase
MSGVGKSAVGRALQDRGFVVVDTDRDASRIAPDGEWLWDEDTIEQVLALEDALVIVGCASNQVHYYDRFDVVVLLSAPTGVMIERIESRTDNPFGKDESEMATILANKRTIEPMLRGVAHHEIATDRPLADVVDDIARLAGDR